MFRTAYALLFLSGFTAAACTQNPLVPTGSEPGALSASTAAKPGGGSPPSTPHATTFTAPVLEIDGLPSPGHVVGGGIVSGWITGTAATGNVLASGTAANYTITVTDTDELPDWVSSGEVCIEEKQQQLRDAGILAAPVTGTFTVNIDQAGTRRTGARIMSWSLTNITQQAGYRWEIRSQYSVNFRPFIHAGSGQAGITVTHENSDTSFKRYPLGANTPDLTVGGCRVDFTFTMTPQ
jgi:hypothetical protein